MVSVPAGVASLGNRPQNMKVVGLIVSWEKSPYQAIKDQASGVSNIGLGWGGCL